MVELTLHACIKSDADDKEVIEILKNFEIVKPVKPFNVVHKDEASIYPHDFTIDWDAGYKAACDDIRDFCIEKQHEIVKNIENPDTWNKGFLAGLLCVQKEIQEGDYFE